MVQPRSLEIGLTMNPALSTVLESVFARQARPEKYCHDAVAAIMEGQCDDISTAAFLTALKVDGESIQDIVGAARAMIERAERVPTTRNGLLDTCGTGGDELRTFNISTVTAFVAAACGIPVAKHGNRSVSSSSGSADVLEALGVRTNLTPAQVGRCIDELGIGFCFAPVFHGAMRHAAPVRKALRFRTLFNLLGPLTNPANAEFQLLGASRIATAEKLAHAAALLGRQRALVVCGNDELDEISLWGETTVFEGSATTGVRRLTWTADSFGLPECDVTSLKVSSPAESAARIRGILAGETGPSRDIVIANAAAALVASATAKSPLEAAKAAAAAIDNHSAEQLLTRFSQFTQSIADPA